MLRIRAACTLVVSALVLAFAPNPPASAAIPDASVAINPQAYEGQFQTILGSLFARCAPGFAFDSLEIVVSQAGVLEPQALAGTHVDCDGQWHKQQFRTSQSAWHPGPATVRATLIVRDVGTGEAALGVQTREIYVRPGAKIELPATATLRPNGVVKLVLKARCDKPWLLQEFGLDAEQGEFPSLAADSFYSDTFPTCDGVLHSRTLFLQSSPTAFKRGWITVNAHIHTLDPEQFDPAPSTTVQRAVLVQ